MAKKDRSKSAETEKEAKKARYLESVEVVAEHPKKLALLGNFEGGEQHTLARVGEGETDFRSADTINNIAAAFSEQLMEGYRLGWLKANGWEHRRGYVSIQYDENDSNLSTSYKGVSIELSGGDAKNFFSGDPAVDYKEMCAFARKHCEVVQESSSVNHFCSAIPGFRWNEKDELEWKETHSVSLKK